MEKLVLIDGYSLLNRAFYATPVFTTKNGVPTNAIFGFVKLMLKIIDDLNPEYLIVALDVKAPTFRHEMYDNYKGTRKEMPEELAAQIEPWKNLLAAMNVATCSKAGFEADDIIGTLSKKFNVHSLIYTGDKDSFQLVSDKTYVYFTKRGVSDLLKLNSSNFEEINGITPSQVIDLKALMGDKSDNIPGVAGIGEKTAKSLLTAHSNLDGIYEHLDDISGSVKTKLSENRDTAYLSYKLAKIKTDCDIDVTLSSCVTPKKFGEDVKKIFTELEFKSLLVLDIFTKDSTCEVKRELPERVPCVSFNEFLKYSDKACEFTVITDDSTIEIYTNGVIVEIKTPIDLLGEGMPYEEQLQVLRHVFSNSKNKVLSYDYKKLLHFIDGFGIVPECEFEDLSLLIYIDNQGSGVEGLVELCEQNGYSKDCSAYAVHELFKEYEDSAVENGVVHVYKDIEKPLLHVLFEMEKTGVSVSLEILDSLSKKFSAAAEEYKQKIYDDAGCEFNINSPTQLGEVLCNKLNITEIRKSKSKISTAADVLEKIKDKYPIVEKVLKYRQYQKLVSTYLEGIRPLIKGGVVHTTYNQTSTSTGRLSSTNPNLQSIPIRENDGRELRKIFLAREGNVLIDADYSQIELRLLAHFSKCKELVEAYNNEIDIHAVTASQVFGVPIEEVTPSMRRDAKAVNFGIIYGISDYGLANNLNIPTAKAKEYIEKYFESYSAVKEYMNKNVEDARRDGFVSTISMRKRKIAEINSPNFSIRHFGERAAMNMPLQGSSADIIKIAMINVSKALKKNNMKTRLILQVHDELVLDSPEEEAEKAAEILKYEMENAVKLEVPLTVDVHMGKNWYDAK